MINLSQFKQYKERSLAALEDRQLGRAIAPLEEAFDRSMPPSLARRVEAIREDYRLMVESVLDGQEDTEREKILEDLSSRLVALWTQLERQLTSVDNPSLYFSTMRYERLHPEDNFGKLTADYDDVNAKILMVDLSGDASGKESTEYLVMLRQREEIQRRLFNRLWTGFPLGEEASEALTRMFLNEDFPVSMKAQMVSALTLGQLAYYDERRQLILIRIYLDSRNEAVKLRALSGILLSMWVNRDRPASRALRLAYTELELAPQWAADVKMAYMQFIRTRDTKRLNKKFNEEILPEMLKMRPDINRRMKDIEQSGENSSPEDNPEWEEILDKSGIKDKLKELSEIQEDGGDVLVGTFSKMKNFPFFNEIGNWFLPYDPARAVFTEPGYKGLEPLVRLIGEAPILCDSDKYSMALALDRLPQAQRQMITSQMEAQSLQMEEARKTDLLPEEKKRDNYLNKYVQDLYRFFTLFPRAKEIANPFDTALNLASLKRLSSIFDDADSLMLIGEFYFNRFYFADALVLFERLSEKVPPSVPLFQKLGHCYYKTGDIEKALEQILHAELLKGDSTWTLRRIANCYVALGQYEKALEYFKRVETIKPDELSLANSIATALVRLERFDEALNYYYKMEFFTEGRDVRALRGIALCSAAKGDDEKALATLDRIALDYKMSAQDYALAGHVNLACRRPRLASELYRESVKDTRFNLRADMLDYLPLFRLRGIDPLTIKIITDI